MPCDFFPDLETAFDFTVFLAALPPVVFMVFGEEGSFFVVVRGMG